MKRYVFLNIVILTCVVIPATVNADYLIGAGQHDITGPAADVMLMGYVDPKQTSAGISSRLRSRAFIVVDEVTGNRVVLAAADQLNVSESVIQKVVEKLKNRYGNLYTEKNILIQSTHTHSAPGGFSHYKLYTTFTTLGYSEQNYEIYSDGVFQSIVKAHENLQPGKIKISRGRLEGLGVNRSASAYELNPASEKERYGENTDKDMTVLKFEGLDGKEVGVISWFALHATSMKKDNHLISSDNKGYASYLFEREKQVNYFSKNSFIAAFPNSNAGDVSPTVGKNLNKDKEWDCDLIDGFKCAEFYGRKQYEKAKELYDSAFEEIQGSVDYRHRYLDFSNINVSHEYTGNVDHLTCYGAIGISMLAGAEDGVGVGDEEQSCSTHPSALTIPLCATPTCHGEKPVVIATGLKQPTPWTPQIIPISVVRLGQLALIGVPAEFTTMSGRRTRETVGNILKDIGVKYSVLAGYANGYAGYVATKEEYQNQDYEGASTHFGEWTLAAYQQELSKLASALVHNQEVQSTVFPLDLSLEKRSPTPRNPPSYDSLPSKIKFGQQKGALNKSYNKGEAVSVEFWSSYPNRDMLIQSSFLEVQKKEGESWVTKKYDWDFDTKYIWKKSGGNKSVARIEWLTDNNSEPGTYRILHRAVAQNRAGQKFPFEGFSNEFELR